MFVENVTSIGYFLHFFRHILMFLLSSFFFFVIEVMIILSNTSFTQVLYLFAPQKCGRIRHFVVIADNNECISNPCVHGECTDKVDGYVCDCQLGFTGINCQSSQFISLENRSQIIHLSHPSIHESINSSFSSSIRPSFQA